MLPAMTITVILWGRGEGWMTTLVLYCTYGRPEPLLALEMGQARNDDDWLNLPYPSQPIRVRYGPQWANREPMALARGAQSATASFAWLGGFRPFQLILKVI